MNDEFIITESFNPSREEILTHSLQVWLHAARKLGTEELGKPRQLSYLIKDKEGNPIGGLYAKIQMRVIFVESAWISPEFQSKGLSRLLSHKLFSFAMENQCEYMLAFSYDFYDALSYLLKNDKLVEIAAKIENCPAPHSLYLFKRRLEA